MKFRSRVAKFLLAAGSRLDRESQIVVSLYRLGCIALIYKPLNGCYQLFGLNGFGNVTVHACRKASLLVAPHGIGGHGDDRNVRPGRLFLFPNRGGSFKTIHLWHLHIHQHNIETFLFQRFQGFPAIARNGDLVAANKAIADARIAARSESNTAGQSYWTRIGSLNASIPT